MPKFHWANTSDLPDANDFVAQHFGPGSLQTQPGRLAWLGFGHPTGTHTCLGLEDNKTVAICCHIPATVTLGQKEFAAAFGVDMMIDPSYRRRGIGQEILHQRQERYDLSLSTGQSLAMANLYKHQGVGQVVAHWCRALYVRRLRLDSRLKWSLRETLAYLHGRKQAPIRGERQPLSLKAACSLLADIPARFTSDEAGILATPEHFAWRYSGPIYRDYSFFSLETPTGAKGLLITRQEQQTEHLIDLFCTPEARRDCFRLAGQSTPGNRMLAMNAGRPLAHALRQAGFFIQAGNSQVIAASNNPDLIDQLAKTEWCSFPGESDADLIRMPRP